MARRRYDGYQDEISEDLFDDYRGGDDDEDDEVDDEDDEEDSEDEDVEDEEEDEEEALPGWFRSCPCNSGKPFNQCCGKRAYQRVGSALHGWREGKK